MSKDLLHDHHAIWRKKPILRDIYAIWYQRIISALLPGKTLEIGGGSGNFKEFFPDTLTSDIVSLPWLDLVLNAHSLPFRGSSIANVVSFDVLHHLENPVWFFEELDRVLEEHGRAHFLEPYISPASYPVYRFIHPEPLILSQDPFHVQKPAAGRQPFDANQAVPFLLFFKHATRFRRRFPGFRFVQRHRLSFLAYPLSGGFDHPSLLPEPILRFLLGLERYFQCLSPVLAFRLLVTLEKVSSGGKYHIPVANRALAARDTIC